ncbi:MAG: outer membrane lipid asymmetry maintenance protein MlaD [Gammaproteobacteria bacterium]|nr:outer membrane lipid asymmetry maintenance protein MlaD [Gammaproteobacteria bacterium]
MKKTNFEMTVGIFLIIGLLSFSYLAIKMGGVGFFEADSYRVKARFNSISGLKEGASIEIAGVKVGKVVKIDFDTDEYEAVVQLKINNGIKLQEDSIASIRTSGIIGDKYIKLTPGGAEEYLESGDEIEETESAISLEELVSKYIFEKEE